jgi:hypothetical protein
MHYIDFLGFLEQIGEDRIAHSRLSKLYVYGNPQGNFFQIMYVHRLVSSIH